MSSGISEADLERARSISMLEVASPLSDLKGKKEQHGPCPVCGGNDRFWVFADDRGWSCRGCGKSGDAIALMMHVHQCDFPTAVGHLLGGTFKNATPRKAIKPNSKEEWRKNEWQTEVRGMAKKARSNLPRNPEALAYLESRAISPDLQRIFGLGYLTPFHPRIEKRIPAITIPWLAASGSITALKFRALNPESPKDRFWQKGGSEQLIFGAHLRRQTDRIIISEGELNAISLFAAVNLPTYQYDIISLGGDTNRSMIAHLATIYPKMLLWHDDVKEFERAAATLPHGYKAESIISPKPDGGRSLDANDILIRYGPKVLAELVNSTLGSWRT